MSQETKKYACLSISGGMDSSTLLLRLLSEGYEVTALGFNYGQKHSVELQRSKQLIKYLNKKGFNVKHQIIELKGLQNLLSSNLVKGGADVPTGFYEEQSMVATVVPNRNKIFSSIIQGVALSIANDNNTNVKIALGIHNGDHAIYKDCRVEFRDADYNAFLEGNWDAERVEYYTPYLEVNKFEILQDGERICKELGLDFNAVYRKTNTSYAPITIGKKVYSSYQTGSDVERILGFVELGRKDPVKYADETGEVSWEVAKAFAIKAKEDFKAKQQ